MRSPLRFGSRAACAVDRNLSVAFAKVAAFGQSAIPPQASGNHAAQGFCKNQPTLLSRHGRSPCGASGRRGHASARAGRDRRHHCRRRLSRHCRGAPHRRRRAALCARRGVRSYRRPLHHRHQDVRRAVRSRRALDLRARSQSADQADAAPRHRGLSGAAEPEDPHRPALCARRRARGLSRRRGARHPRHQRRARARPTCRASR